MTPSTTPAAALATITVTRKPVQCEAMQFLATYDNAERILSWMNAKAGWTRDMLTDPPVTYYYGQLTIRSDRGDLHAVMGDWVICTESGATFQPIPDAMFRSLYDIPEDAAKAVAAGRDTLTKLATFGARCLIESRRELADLDGGWMQDTAVKCGVLIEHVMTTPCGPSCRCATDGAFEADGDAFVCYRYPDSVRELVREIPASGGRTA
ncbi:MAG: hypothetical protein JWM95_1729 [Gemmatimonadetes bacterium]|nr:hypothetical protein [Gemmatimonadota bacterium]